MIILGATDNLAAKQDVGADVNFHVMGDDVTLAGGTDAYVLLGQGQLSTTAAALCSSPASGHSFIIGNIKITNTGASTRTITLYVKKGGTSYTVTEQWGTPIQLAAGETAEWSPGGWTEYNSLGDPIVSAAPHEHTTAAGNPLTADEHLSYLELTSIADPAATAAGKLRFYSKTISGRPMPKFIGPAGIDHILQPALWANGVDFWVPTNVAAGLWLGTTGLGAGTFADELPTTTNLYTATHRAAYRNVVTTTNQSLGQSQLFAGANRFRGSIAAQGGFFFFCRFGFSVWTGGGRLFVGLSVTQTPCVGQPSALLNCLGFGIDAADTAITFMHNDGAGAAVKDTIAGQPALATNQGYDAYIWCKPNDTVVYYRLDNLLTGAVIIDTVTGTTDLPVNTTMMCANAIASNAALTPVNSIGLGVGRIYVESDY